MVALDMNIIAQVSWFFQGIYLVVGLLYCESFNHSSSFGFFLKEKPSSVVRIEEEIAEV